MKAKFIYQGINIYNMMGTTHIDNLPVETFIEILTKIDGKTLGRCRRVCHKWKECIDEIDLIWQKMCNQEFPFSSIIAKRKCGNNCGWYHLYRNLKLWSDLTNFEKNVKMFFKFSLHDKSHMLDIDHGVLPLKDANGIVLYDVSTLKYIPVAIPERNCFKIVHNNQMTIIHIKSGILVQRTTKSPQYATEMFFKADNFVLANDSLYFCNNRDIFKCDLNLQDLNAQMITHCDYDIKEMVYSEGLLHIFTDCGKIVNINKNKEVTVKPLNCPIEWIRQIKHICAVNDRNFVCYSRNLFKIETDKYKHLYLDFPPITALFFYVDVVLIGTRMGEILLYRLSSQKKAIKPIFETLAVLPDGKFPVQLDVCERRTGPLIIASTFFELFHIDINFFPNEQQSKHIFTTDKIGMYKRLLKLKYRF